MDFENIKIERQESLAFIIINRPEVRNSLNRETIGEMRQALQWIRQEESIGCVIFTGAGEKSFAAGADIKVLKERKPLDALRKDTLQDLYNEIEEFEKPTIAMINGHALGGGFELALACDIRVASQNAKIGLPELNLSIIPGAGGTQRLVRIVGKGKALELILTGKILTSDEAERIGLVSASVPQEKLKDKTLELAGQILGKGPVAAKLAKMAVSLGFDTDIKTGLMLERLAQAVLFSTQDMQEGTSAFLEKRKPEFQGK